MTGAGGGCRDASDSGESADSFTDGPGPVAEGGSWDEGGDSEEESSGKNKRSSRRS